MRLYFAWTTQEQLQSGIMMASVNQIDSNFLCDSVCVSSMWVTMCHVLHVHMPFYEGTCQNLLWGTLATLEQLQSQRTQSALSTFGIFSVLAGCLWDLRISKYSHTGGEGKMPQHCTVHCHAFIWPEFTRIVWGWHWRSPWTRQTWHTRWQISYLEISLSMWLLY